MAIAAIAASAKVDLRFDIGFSRQGPATLLHFSALSATTRQVHEFCLWQIYWSNPPNLLERPVGPIHLKPTKIRNTKMPRTPTQCAIPLR
jgi:hypothetical protein